MKTWSLLSVVFLVGCQSTVDTNAIAHQAALEAFEMSEQKRLNRLVDDLALPGTVDASPENEHIQRILSEGDSIVLVLLQRMKTERRTTSTSVTSAQGSHMLEMSLASVEWRAVKKLWPAASSFVTWESRMPTSTQLDIIIAEWNKSKKLEPGGRALRALQSTEADPSIASLVLTGQSIEPNAGGVSVLGAKPYETLSSSEKEQAFQLVAKHLQRQMNGDQNAGKIANLAHALAVLDPVRARPVVESAFQVTREQGSFFSRRAMGRLSADYVRVGGTDKRTVVQQSLDIAFEGYNNTATTLACLWADPRDPDVQDVAASYFASADRKKPDETEAECHARVLSLVRFSASPAVVNQAYRAFLARQLDATWKSGDRPISDYVALQLATLRRDQDLAGLARGATLATKDDLKKWISNANFDWIGLVKSNPRMSVYLN